MSSASCRLFVWRNTKFLNCCQYIDTSRSKYRSKSIASRASRSSPSASITLYHVLFSSSSSITTHKGQGTLQLPARYSSCHCNAFYSGCVLLIRKTGNRPFSSRREGHLGDDRQSPPVKKEGCYASTY